MTNRVRDAIERIRTNPNLYKLEGKQAITFQEHAAYQTTQSQAFASNKLTMNEAYICYQALGEVWSEENEGWAPGTDLATKVMVTQLVGELMGITV